jgi:ribonuclease P protein component
MDTVRYTFRKTERLCSKKIISGLFENGNVFYTPVFKVVWATSPVTIPSPAQVVFSIAKRMFPHAVTRNLIRRRIKEAYRKNKHLLYNNLAAGNIQIVFIVIFKEKNVPDYLSVEKSMVDMLNKLLINIQKEVQKC